MRIPNPINKYVLSIDKLHIQLRRAFIEHTGIDNFFTNHTDVNLFTINRRNAKDSYESDGYLLQKDFKCTDNLFHLQYSAYRKGILIGVLFLDHTKTYENTGNLLPFRLDNRVLYGNWIQLLTGFMKAFDFNINNYTAVDIALDTNENPLDNFLYYFDKDTKYHFLQAGKMHNDIETRGKRYRGGKRNESFYIGSKKSDKRTVMYNKSLEILEESGKDYITAYHAANGLDVTKDVYRVEVQLDGKLFTTTATVYQTEATDAVTADGELITIPADILSAYRYKNSFLKACLAEDNNEGNKASKLSQKHLYPIDYLHFNDSFYLTQLFADFHSIKFKKADASRVTNCTDIMFFDFNIYGKAQSMKPAPIYTTTKNNDYRNEKKMLKDCVARFKETAKLFHLEYAAELATANNLTGILNLLLDEYNTDYTIECNSLRRVTADLVLDNRLHIRF